MKTLLVLLTLLVPSVSHAYYDERLSLSAGIERYGSPASTYALIGAEFEYRFTGMFGAGGLVEYLFSTPGVTRIGLPVFYHPLEGDWLFLAAPIVEFQTGATQAGVRVGTRVPIPLGPIHLIPSLDIDFIGGNENLIVGLGIQF